MLALLRIALLAPLLLALADLLLPSAAAGESLGKPVPAQRAVAGERIFSLPAGPLVDPQKALDEGEQALLMGDYKTAIAKFFSIVELRSDAPQVAEARFNLAIALFFEGDYQDAAEAFVEFRARHLGHQKSDTALFWLAQSYLKTSRLPEAEDLYRNYAERQPLVADHVGLLRVQTLLQLGKVEQARGLATTIADTTHSPSLSLQARWLAAQALEALNKHQGAAEAYAALIPQATDDASKASLLFLAAESWRLAGQRLKQNEALTTLVQFYPRYSQALQALQTLERADDAALTPHQKGRVYFYQRQNSQALQAFQQQINLYPNGPEKPSSHYLLAIVYERLDMNTDALRELATVVEQTPDHPAAKDALWEQGWLLSALKRYDDAALSYQLFLKRYAGTALAEEARFREGFMRYLTGNISEAANVWAKPGLDLAKGVNKGLNNFWLAKAQTALGDQVSAAAAQLRISQLDAGHYYAYRARELQTKRPLSAEPALPDFSSLATISPAEVEAARTWLAQWSPPAEAILWPEVHQHVMNNQAVQRGALLQELGIGEAATQEFRAAAQSNTLDMPFLLTLAQFLHEKREYAAAMLAVSEIMAAAPAAMQKAAPRFLNKILYPLPYHQEVLEQSRTFGLDPLLLFALMKQESLFDQWATSSVGARGLTQVMPTTGRDIADNLAFSDFKVDDLYRPTVSIRFGSFYIARQLRFLAQNPVFALAGYNGGPGNALRWMNNDRGMDPDLFVELIEYDETSLYVKVVMENYYRYRETYLP